MRRFLHNKPFILSAGIISILLIVLLTTGLNSLEFKAGTPFSYVVTEETSPVQSIEYPNLGWMSVVTVVILLVITIFVLILATPKQRKILLAILLAMAVIFLGIMWWISRSDSGSEAFMTTPTLVHTAARMTESPDQSTPLPTGVVYTPPKVSPWISIGISFFVLLLAGGVTWFFIYRRWRETPPLEDLAGIAEQAVLDLQSGKDYGDIILNCYADMIEAVNKQRGIRRRGNLTPKEFIAVLERARLPVNPVRRITTLFERVRYGGAQTTSIERDEAVVCLNEIIHYIREAA